MRVWISVLIMLVAACRPEGSEVDAVSSTGEYFDVQGLINKNAALLREMDVLLYKKATFAGEVEEATIRLDSAILAAELDVFREVDINKPVLADRYLVEKEVVDGLEVIIYRADEEEELNINYLKVFKDLKSGELERIEAFFSSKNILYNSTRLLSMQYGEVSGMILPLYYTVEGSQKMIFYDKENYFIKADFIYEASPD